MRGRRIHRAWLVAAAPALFAAMVRPAAADDAWALSGSVHVASDERDRGLSLTAKDPGAGGELFLDHRAGWFLGLTIRRIDLPTGEDAEIAGVLGRTGSAGAYDWAVNLSLTGLAGGRGRVFAEARAEVSRDFGLAIAYAQLAAAPDGRWLERDGFVGDARFGLEAPVPQAPRLALFAEIGVEWPARTHARGHWRIGGRLRAGPLLISVAYEDTTSALAIARAGVLARLSVPF